MANILITGGAGNLGSALAHRLKPEGHHLRLSDLPQADFSALGSLNAEIIPGDIRDFETVRQLVSETDVIYHLAALLPPFSEVDLEHTLQVNVGGTKNIIRATRTLAREPHLIFSSSVSVYGDTRHESLPIGVEHATMASDCYSESKILSEEIIIKELKYFTIMRISGIAIPAFMDTPEVWQFRPEQRIEMIHIGDLLTALVNSVHAAAARGKIFNISGGESWRMYGRDFVEAFCRALDLPKDKQRFQSQPGWFDWYDTREPEQILRYQATSFAEFERELRQAALDAMNG